MIWGAMGVSGLSNLHIVPTGKTVDSCYYTEQMLKKELKPALNRTRTTGKIMLENWYPTLVWLSLCRMGLLHIRRPHHRLYRETRMAWQFTRSKLYGESMEYIGV